MKMNKFATMVAMILAITPQMAPAASNDVVTHPTKPGAYTNGDWTYEYNIYTIGTSPLEHRQGILKFKGIQVTEQIGTVIDTPFGRFMSFDVVGGGQQGYNTGWLMTLTNDRPVFDATGTVTPAALIGLPLKRGQIHVVPLGDLWAVKTKATEKE